MKQVRRFDVLGIKVSEITINGACVMMKEWINQNTPNYVCVTGVHGVMESQQDSNLRDIHNTAGLVVPDGRPLSWIANLLGYREAERVYGPDLMLAMCKISAEKGYTNYLYGAAPGIAERLKARLIQCFPQLKIVGTYSPPYRGLTAEEEQRLIEEFDRLSPDILWVGLSTPKQEYWMKRYISKLNTRVMVGVGAAFDFISGAKRQAPKWMQKIGMEWLFRLIMEPRRLWKRYLLGNTLFLYLIIKELLSGKLLKKVKNNPDI
jgi:N-acetylglucosaminyldiphosphoundecaprenol N-acetyl-beta-D-mannosaminyltransferase